MGKVREVRLVVILTDPLDGPAGAANLMRLQK